jgi:hypothetical protein
MSPSSILHLIIRMEIEFLTHFYSRKYEIKLENGKEPRPSRVLYIGPNESLNDYYAPRV